MMEAFPREVVRAVVRSEPIRWSAVGGGYTPVGRWIVEFGNGLTAFVKAGEGDEAVPIRREIATLSGLDGSFSPVMLGSHDDHQRAVLVLEDLSGWRWPPPYPDSSTQLFAMLDAVAAHYPAEGLIRLEKPHRLLWPAIAADPSGILGLGVVTERWLADAYDELVRAEEAFDPTGDDLVHNDIWAGNIATSERRCVLIDWSEAKRGSALVDRGFMHLSLRSEGGPRPTTRFDGDLSFAAWWSAQLAVRLVEGPDPRLNPAIDAGLLQDLQAALNWVAELLDLPSPDPNVS